MNPSEKPLQAGDTRELDALEAQLARVSGNWAVASVARSFSPDEDGQEDFQDEALLFEIHGYRSDASKGTVSSVTFIRGPDGRPSQRPRAGKVKRTSAPVLTRTYTGSLAEIELERKADAKALAVKGYYPRSQDYIPGAWGTGAWVLAVLLIFLFGLGLLVLIYLVAVKPPGTLTVIYERHGEPVRPSARAEGRTEAPSADRSLATRLSQLEDARKAGLISDDEHAARRARILDET